MTSYNLGPGLYFFILNGIYHVYKYIKKPTSVGTFITMENTISESLKARIFYILSISFS